MPAIPPAMDHRSRGLGFQIFNIIIMIAAAVSIVLRFWSRFVNSSELSILARFWWDDWLALSALVCGLSIDASDFSDFL
jgi:hypothetical protein